MKRPDNLQSYKEIDLKLGIKSSLKKAKSTIAMVLLLWLTNDKKAKVKYSVQVDKKLEITQICKDNIIRYLSNEIADMNIDVKEVVSALNSNCLLQSQIESLIVALELVWRLARVQFVDKSKANSAERSGNERYEKEITFTSNIDLMEAIVSSNSDYNKILLLWILDKRVSDELIDLECLLIKALTCFAEDAICKLKDEERDIIFNFSSVYAALDSAIAEVDINGDEEQKGALRVIKGALGEGLNSYLSYKNGTVFVSSSDEYEKLQQYAERVRTYHSLQNLKLNSGKVAVETEKSYENDVLKLQGIETVSLSLEDLAVILKEMYNTADTGMQVASIYIFGIRYGNVIIEGNFRAADIINQAKMNASYSSELQKALNVYKCLAEGTFGLTIEQSKWLENVMEFSSGYPSEFARNRIVFGAPGTGKSYKLNKEKDILLSKGGECERVTFHPSYSYANFVGTYKPISSKDKEGKDIIKYEYVPGPFMRTYVKALQNNQDKENVRPYLLLIEEINRANVAAVFGEVFQLLDRARDNASEYTIQATEDMKKYLAKELKCSETAVEILKIPDNMFIWATMNSADQGVFPIDTAFKRRWEFEYIGVDDEIKDVDINSYVIPIGNKDNRKYVKWNDLRTKINDILVSDDCKVNEDKLLGPFFMSKNMLENALKEQEKFVKAFESKVIMYLCEDAMKMRPKNIFKGHKGRMIFSELCKTFEKYGEGLFEITDIAYQELEVKE